MDALLEAFRKDVCAKSAKIDPDESLDWFALSIGFFLARGATISKAHTLAIKARYKHHYWL